MRQSPRRRTAAVVLAGVCAFLTLYAPQPLLPALAAAFHATAARISLVMTASTLAVALAAPLAGAVADRFGRRRVIVASAFLLSIPTLLAGTSATLGQLLFWRFWQGLVTPGVFAVTVAYINEEWETGTGSGMAAYVTGTVIGGYAGRMLSALVASYLTWRWSFAILGAMSATSAAALLAWLPPGRRFVRAGSEASPVRSMARHLRNPRLRAAYAVGFGMLFTLVATFTYINFYLAAPPFRLGTAKLGLLFTVYLVGAVITPLGGRVIDRMGHRFTLVAAAGSSAAGIAMTLARSLPVVVAGLALFCTGVFIAQAASTSYVGAVAQQARAAAVGLYVMFYYLGGTFGSAVPGALWSRGGWRVCTALIVAVQLSAILVALLFWKPAQRHRGEAPVIEPC